MLLDMTVQAKRLRQGRKIKQRIDTSREKGRIVHRCSLEFVILRSRMTISSSVASCLDDIARIDEQLHGSITSHLEDV